MCRTAATRWVPLCVCACVYVCVCVRVCVCVCVCVCACLCLHLSLTPFIHKFIHICAHTGSADAHPARLAWWQQPHGDDRVRVPVRR
jgi:hypothetical protein